MDVQLHNSPAIAVHHHIFSVLSKESKISLKKFFQESKGVGELSRTQRFSSEEDTKKKSVCRAVFALQSAIKDYLLDKLKNGNFVSVSSIGCCYVSISLAIDGVKDVVHGEDLEASGGCGSSMGSSSPHSTW